MDIETRLAKIEEQQQRIIELLERQGTRLPDPLPVSNSAARLISMARTDRAAAIAEAKRLSRESSKKKADHARH